MITRGLIAAVILTFLLATILGGVMEKQAPGAGEGDVDMLQTLMSPLTNFVKISFHNEEGSFTLIPRVEFPWISAMWHAILLDTALFEGYWGILIKYGIWALLGIPLIIGLGILIANLIRGSSA